MSETVYMLQHGDKLQFHCGVFKTRDAAEKATTDPVILSWFKPAVTLKYFGQPGEYDKLLAEFKPPSIVEFTQNANQA